MGGDLTLESGAGPGSRFRLFLTAERAAVADSAQAVQREDPVWPGKRVLCVDDNDNNRRIVELLLRRFGVDVQACATGAEAIDLCSLETFDAILMDIVMPDMDGIETLKRLRSDSSCLNRSTPAIAVTAKLSADNVASYTTAGFDSVAGKPINVRELAAAIAPFMTPHVHRRTRQA
jgi:CheY-like chemotaxis protein